MKATIILGMLALCAVVAAGRYLDARYPGVVHAAVGAWLGGATWLIRGLGRGVRGCRRALRRDKEATG